MYRHIRVAILSLLIMGITVCVFPQQCSTTFEVMVVEKNKDVCIVLCLSPVYCGFKF